MAKEGKKAQKAQKAQKAKATVKILFKLNLFIIAGAGFEPAALGLWAPRATRLLYPAKTK